MRKVMPVLGLLAGWAGPGLLGIAILIMLIWVLSDDKEWSPGPSAVTSVIAEDGLATVDQAMP